MVDFFIVLTFEVEFHLKMRVVSLFSVFWNRGRLSLQSSWENGAQIGPQFSLVKDQIESDKYPKETINSNPGEALSVERSLLHSWWS